MKGDWIRKFGGLTIYVLGTTSINALANVLGCVTVTKITKKHNDKWIRIEKRENQIAKLGL